VGSVVRWARVGRAGVWRDACVFGDSGVFGDGGIGRGRCLAAGEAEDCEENERAGHEVVMAGWCEVLKLACLYGGVQSS
jgi:hypothetical protein